MKYIVLDGVYSGTGVWDKYLREYLNPFELKISHELQEAIRNWAEKYKTDLFEGFPDTQSSVFHALDEEGVALSKKYWTKQTSIR